MYHPWEIRGIFFYTDSAARPVIRPGYFGFSIILESFPRREPVSSWYSNIQIPKKAAHALFSLFAKQLCAQYGILWKHPPVIYTILRPVSSNA